VTDILRSDKSRQERKSIVNRCSATDLAIAQEFTRAIKSRQIRVTVPGKNERQQIVVARIPGCARTAQFVDCQ